MAIEGPEIERLTRRLAECPGEFLASPDYVAVICDQLRVLSPEPPEVSGILSELRKASPAHQELLAVACWMLRDDWFQTHKPDVNKLLKVSSLKPLSDLVKPAMFVQDADRREELARRCLSLMSLIPRGETAAQAADRLTAIDSVERHRVLQATAAAERRAREIREAMARKKAEESASRYSE